MKRWVRKLRMWRRGRQLDRDLEEEFQFHLDSRAAETGDSANAPVSFGNATALKEACRELRMFPRLDVLWQDLRYAFRTLARTPGFTLVAVVALALGIGADTAIFTIVKGAFSWDLGLDHVDRMILVSLADSSHRQDFGMSYPDFLDLRSQATSLEGLAAYRMASVNLSDNRSLPERYYCVTMSANGFLVSEQKPVLGRGFVADDERPGAPPVAVLSYHVWQDRYGKDPGMAGKTIRVNDVPHTVVGVMPPGKRFPEETDLWTPLIPDAPALQRANRDLMLFGRLPRGGSTAAAGAQLATISTRLAKQFPDSNKGLTAEVQPIGQITGAYNMRPLFAALWVAVGFVLLIACADVAIMLLARGAGRAREISIRVAIGAGRGRILRQLLVESVILSIAGGFLGWLVALGGLRWFDAGTGVVPKPVWLQLSLDGMAFLYLAAVSIGAGIFFGLAPALRLSKIDVYAAIKDGGQGVAGRRRALSLSNGLVALQMALCIVLLSGAGLMIRSTVNLYAAPLGMDPAGVLTMRINLPEAKYPLPESQVHFHRTLQARLEALAGVESAGIVSNLPLGSWIPVSYELEGAVSDPGHSRQTGALVASPTYFRVMGVNPRRGRLLLETDAAGAPVVLVNETFAHQLWPDGGGLGKRLRLAGNPSSLWLTVVGIVPDILQNFRNPLEHDPLIYLPFSEDPRREMFIVARTRVPPATLARPFRRAVRNLDENLPVYEVRTLEGRLAESRLTVNLLGAMFAVFAAVALVLATVGLYAVTAHSVGQRTQEIGVRMAVGGTRRDILRLVFAQGIRPLLLGVVLGLPAAFGVTRVLRAVLVGVSPGDPVSFTLVVVVLAAAGVLGCAVPARRATRVDPIVALRYE